MIILCKLINLQTLNHRFKPLTKTINRRFGTTRFMVIRQFALCNELVFFFWSYSRILKVQHFRLFCVRELINFMIVTSQKECQS